MNISPFFIIAVDGGAASGKSTTSNALAKQLNLLHVDTGSHYRSITLELLEKNITLDEPSINEALKAIELGTFIDKNAAHMTVHGKCHDIQRLRSIEVNQNVSHVAAISCVRECLLSYQRSQADLAQEKQFSGLVMEGRDIGSVIFPNADLSIYLEADAEVRSQRRAKEGQNDTISERDRIDTSRKAAPLVCPEGALRINTTSAGIDDVIHMILEKIKSLKLGVSQ